MEIKTRAPKANNGDGAEFVGEYDFGADCDDAIQKFGKETVFSLYSAQAKVDYQGGVRRCLEGNLDVEKWVSGWKPGDKGPRAVVDPLTVAKKAFEGMNKDAQRAFIAALKG